MKIYLPQLIEESDLVLVDNSFLNGADGDLAEKIYHLRHPSLLTHYALDFAKNNRYLQWMRDDVIRMPHVFAVPAIVEEMKVLQKHLKMVWDWSGDPIHWVTALRKNETRKKSLETVLDEDVLDEEKTVSFRRRKMAHGLNPLWQYRHLVQTITRRLNIYEGETFDFPQHQPGIANADYQLFGAGIQILLEDKNPDKNVSLLTRDRHYLKLINECYQHNLLIEGRIIVYNFNEWQEEAGYIPLKNKAVYEGSKNVRLRSNL